MQIELLELGGFRAAMMALRLSYGKEPRSKTAFVINVKQPRTLEHVTHIDFDTNDLQALMPALVNRGDDHSKVLRGVCAWVSIKASINWWSEMETYVVGHTRLMSESKMHTIFKGLTGEQIQEALHEIDLTYELEKIDMFNYQTLRRIYHQRKGHRLGEWKVFLDWIETLPYFHELILGEKVQPLDVERIVKENSING